jgi:hypothetical protein
MTFQKSFKNQGSKGRVGSNPTSRAFLAYFLLLYCGFSAFFAQA